VLSFAADKLEPLCADLDAWRQRLDARGPLPRAWEGRLRKELEAEAVQASTAMEGVPVTVEEVRRILAGDRPPTVAPEDRELVTGYRAAMEFVLRRADDPSFRWDRELLVGLHDRVLAGRFAAGAGRLAQGSRFIADDASGRVVYRPPDAEMVPALVDSACQQMNNSSDHCALVAAWIHIAIAAIHPFADGNGRTARVVASLAMYRGGFHRREFTSLEEWWGRHRREYYAAFDCLGERFDPQADVTPFMQAHLSAQLSQIRALDVRSRIETQLLAAIDNLLIDGDLSPRLANAVFEVFFDRTVTAAYYRLDTDVSPPVASSDLKGGVAAGLLSAQGATRDRRYFAGPRLHSALIVALGLESHGMPATRASIVAALIGRADSQASRGY
jgi:Fic family protein